MPDDPRPLTTEPLPLDLVNTEWIDDGERRDLLADVDGLRVWLAGAGLADTPADAAALAHLREARAAIRAALEQPGEGARFRLNAVLAHGCVRERLGAGGPREEVVVDDPSRRAGYLAARGLLVLLRDHPGRLRACASDRCILHFLDTSRSGRRQWCSMAVCGNRAKARRHYARSRPDRPADQE
jgi:predicted RNA-binding Zn ribbon-like protein